ncbi:MAG: hypothetical protein AAGF95_10540 [Chloroflexota bacterium]
MQSQQPRVFVGVVLHLPIAFDRLRQPGIAHEYLAAPELVEGGSVAPAQNARALALWRKRSSGLQPLTQSVYLPRGIHFNPSAYLPPRLQGPGVAAHPTKTTARDSSPALTTRPRWGGNKQRQK